MARWLARERAASPSRSLTPPDEHQSSKLESSGEELSSAHPQHPPHLSQQPNTRSQLQFALPKHFQKPQETKTALLALAAGLVSCPLLPPQEGEALQEVHADRAAQP